MPHGALEALLRDTAKLNAVLTYHVASGFLLGTDLKSGDVKTDDGSPVSITVAGSKVQVNEAHVTKADILASNGDIHVIDAVMFSKNVQLGRRRLTF